jgi:hypothetical protein
VSGYFNDDSDFEDEDRNNSGKGLRKMLEETLAENRKLIQRLEQRERGNSTSELLKSKGLDPAIAELIPDGQDAKEWVDKYAHLLGVPDNHEELAPAVEPEVQLSDDSDPAIVLRRAELAAERQALADMQDAAESGMPASVHNDLVDRMDKITSEEELMKFFRENGAPAAD